MKTINPLSGKLVESGATNVEQPTQDQQKNYQEQIDFLKQEIMDLQLRMIDVESQLPERDPFGGTFTND